MGRMEKESDAMSDQLTGAARACLVAAAEDMPVRLIVVYQEGMPEEPVAALATRAGLQMRQRLQLLNALALEGTPLAWWVFLAEAESTGVRRVLPDERVDAL